MAGGGFITIQVGGFGLELKSQQLATFGHQIEDLSPAWEDVGLDFLQDFSDNFAMEGGFFGGTGSYLGPDGGPWKPLAASTVRERERLGYGGEHPILERDGSLRASLILRGAPGNVFTVSPSGLVIGTDLPSAGFHQTGTSRMPARPIVGISWDRRSGIVYRLDQYVKQLIAAAELGI